MNHHNARRWIIWFLAVIFYFYEYILRVAPSVMISNILTSFNITAGVFGTIVAFYLYAYAPMQLPVGILMDRFGTRKLLSIATVTCGIASIFFGLSHAVWIAYLSRLLIGAGSAFAFIGMIYICSHWFPSKFTGVLVGLGNSIGMLGAVVGEGPLSMIVKLISWRTIMFGLGFIGIALGVTIYISLLKPAPFDEEAAPLKEKKPWSSSLKKVCKNKQTWINAIVTFCFYSSIAAFGGLWAIPFLKQTHNFSNQGASYASSMVYMGIILMGPVIGYIGDRTGNRKLIIHIFTFISLCLFLCILFIPNLHYVTVFILMLLFGGALSAHLLNYTLAIDLNSKKVKGTALALTNFLVFLSSSFIQTLVGFLLDLNWDGKMESGIPVYSTHNFQLSLLPFAFSLSIAFIFSFFIREKKGHHLKYP